MHVLVNDRCCLICMKSGSLRSEHSFSLCFIPSLLFTISLSVLCVLCVICSLCFPSNSATCPRTFSRYLQELRSVFVRVALLLFSHGGTATGQEVPQGQIFTETQNGGQRNAKAAHGHENPPAGQDLLPGRPSAATAVVAAAAAAVARTASADAAAGMVARRR